MDALHQMNHAAVLEKIGLTQDEFVTWFQGLGLRPIGRVCECAFGMTLAREKVGDRAKRYFTCKERDCLKKVRFFVETFLRGKSHSQRDFSLALLRESRSCVEVTEVGFRKTPW